MGWTYTHKDEGESVRDFFSKEFGHANEKRKTRVLDCAVVHIREAYLAFEDMNLVDGTREVFAVVCALDYQPRDYLNFGYKEMEESMGPYYYNCPERILKLLTPTNNEYALKWRRRCGEVIERRKIITKIKNGDILEFGEPIVFKSGYKVQRLQVTDKKRCLFKEPGRSWPGYRLKRHTLINRSFGVVTA